MEVTAGIFIIKDDKILVCHSTNSPWIYWGVPKGLTEPGEEEKEAALREVYEESSLRLDPKRVFYLGLTKYKSRPKQMAAFYHILYPEENIDVSKLRCTSMVVKEDGTSFPEVDKFKWITLPEAYKVLYKPQIDFLPQIEHIVKLTN
jgi:ADP-ribose pyrophosphatase YjhB (NUDIX family)